jgi:hypothetical protein
MLIRKGERFTQFNRTFSRHHGKDQDQWPHYVETFEVTEDITLDALLQPRGSKIAKGGVYEIHTDKGIFRQINNSKIDNTTPLKTSRILFKAWDQMINEEQHGEIIWSANDSIGKAEFTKDSLNDKTEMLSQYYVKGGGITA